MEIQKFINLLLRHKLTLVVLPIIAVIITYYIVTHLPDSYLAQAQISTGIVDQTQKETSINESNQNPMESQINQEFSNLIEMMKMKKIIDQVSYKLIVHDLSSKQPFRKLSGLVNELDEKARKHAYAVYKKKYENREGLNLWNADQNGLSKVVRSMGYDEGSLKQKLTIYRQGSSDFIFVEFSSENPELSAFVANTLCEEFIRYYTSIVKENQNKAVSFWGKLLKEKYKAMNDKILGLKNYKIQNRVLNLYEQSKILYGQIVDFESKKVMAGRDVEATEGALKAINAKFSPGERQYIESVQTKITQDILATTHQLNLLTDKQIQSNFHPRYKTSIDSIKKVLIRQVNEAGDKYINNPLGAKQELISQKIMLEIQRDLSKNGVRTLQEEIDDLNNRFDQLVPNEAVVQTFERDIDITSREYLEILNKYNLTSMESGYSIKLKQVQMAMPGLAQPSKKMLLVILSGMISFIFCVIVLFLLFFMDSTITKPRELANQAKAPVLGYLNALPGNLLDVNGIWNGENPRKEIIELKEQLRSIRFEIENELGSSKALVITSLKEQEGKTFFAINLAYAFSMIRKKVLLIDGNFLSPTISQTSKTKLFLEEYFNEPAGKQDESLTSETSLITVMGNKGGDHSLLELSTESQILESITHLKSLFDVIIIETAPLDTLSKSKEWIAFADKVSGVFEAGKSLNENKKLHLNYLKGLNGKFCGWILNKTRSNAEERKKKKSLRKFFRSKLKWEKKSS